MKRNLVLLIIVLFSPALYASGGEKRAPRVLSLCELVDNWKDHNRQQVRVRAIYAVGAEQTVLYDPACRDGKDLTYVEFRPHTKGATKTLDQLAAKSRRAWVILEGVFYGPELYTNVDPKLPPAIRERLEKSPRHYGHMDSMDTMISVTRVVEASEVATDVPAMKQSKSDAAETLVHEAGHAAGAVQQERLKWKPGKPGTDGTFSASLGAGCPRQALARLGRAVRRARFCSESRTNVRFPIRLFAPTVTLASCRPTRSATTATDISIS